MDSSYSSIYQQYLSRACSSLPTTTRLYFQQKLDRVNWENPKSLSDVNAVGVISLLLADESVDHNIRAMYFEMAREAFQEVAHEYPLCAAHLALMKTIIGEQEEAVQLAFSIFIETCHSNPDNASLSSDLIYVPSESSPLNITQSELLIAGLTAKHAYEQTRILCVDILRRSQLAFYSPSGFRFLQLAVQSVPQSACVNLSLGLASLLNNHWEGLMYLHHAQELMPDYSPTYQALVLAYQALKKPELAHEYWHQAQLAAKITNEKRSWAWASYPLSNPFTYVPFGQEIVLAIEASFRSIVTSVLLAEGDWFEQELEFWRNQLKAGMTVIDVGANVGVYTFSAAEQVGRTGQVIAIEPFPDCVKSMHETCQINNMTWVSVCEGAVSDRNGTAQLALHASSELNEIVDTEADIGISSENMIEVQCFTLDSLVKQQSIETVHWLKIDAEGHELKVLKGSEYILKHFAPGILYENIAASSDSNIEVAEYLIEKGYTLFRYQPFLENLIPIESTETLTGNLNIIALYQNESDD